MNIAEIIQNVATGSAVVLGLTYIVGGLVVNLNLARRGIVEYQIVKIKYLVAGIVFLLQSLGAFTLGFIFAIPLALINYQLELLEGINIISMLAAISLILIWARLPAGTKSFWCTWYYWLIASVLGVVFPMSILIRQFLAKPDDALWTVLLIQAVFTGVLIFLGQIYHYSAFYYGQASELVGMLDPIGVGVPVRIRIACTPESSLLLKSMGVSINKEMVTQDLFLVDETDSNYILGFERLSGTHTNSGTLKVDKSLVKVILFPAEAVKAKK